MKWSESHLLLKLYCRRQVPLMISRPLSTQTEKAKASLKNSELIQRVEEVDSLAEDEQGVLIKIISAYVRDYRAKQAYAS